MITINLIGFAKKIPSEIKLKAANYREALEGLKLREDFNPFKSKVRYICDIDGVNTSLDLDEPVTDGVMILRRKQTLSTIKSFQGSGNMNGWVKVVVGIILITVAIIAPPIAAGWAALGASGMVSLNLVAASIGLSLIAGGLAQELMPTPENNTSDETSNTATSYPNTINSGQSVAMIFGEHRWGGHLFQFNIESVSKSSAKIRDFTNIIWNDVDSNRRDSWLTLFYNSESNEIGQTEWDDYSRGRNSDGIRYSIR